MATKKKFGIGIFLFAMLLTGIVLVSAVSAQEELKVIEKPSGFEQGFKL